MHLVFTFISLFSFLFSFHFTQYDFSFVFGLLLLRILLFCEVGCCCSNALCFSSYSLECTEHRFLRFVIQPYRYTNINTFKYIKFISFLQCRCVVCLKLYGFSVFTVLEVLLLLFLFQCICMRIMIVRIIRRGSIEMKIDVKYIVCLAFYSLIQLLLMFLLDFSNIFFSFFLFVLGWYPVTIVNVDQFIVFVSYLFFFFFVLHFYILLSMLCPICFP